MKTRKGDQKVMKKILALLLTLAMVATLSAVVFAEEIAVEDENITLDIDKCAAAPTIDGKLDADSYKKIDFKANQFSYNCTDQMDYVQSLPLEAYISYDDANVYLLLSGDASKFYYCDKDDDEGNIWQQSCVQASFALADASGGDRLEMGLARSSVTGKSLTQIWAQSPEAKSELALVEGQNFAILLEGGKLNYEIKIPFESFMGANPKAGDKIGFNFIYGWSDNGSREIAEYSAGCAYSGKNADLFAKATLTSNVLQAAAPVVEETPAVVEEAPAVVEEAPAPEATTTTIPAATGDMTIILVVLCAVAGLGVCIAVRKRANVR